MSGSAPRHPGAGSRYSHLEGALKQAIVESDADAERRHRELHDFQQQVAEGDSLRMVLVILMVMAAGCAVAYFPRMFEGDHKYTGVVTIFFALVAAGLVWLLVQRRRRRKAG